MSSLPAVDSVSEASPLTLPHVKTEEKYPGDRKLTLTILPPSREASPIVCAVTKITLPEVSRLLPPQMKDTESGADASEIFASFSSLAKALSEKYGTSFIKCLENTEFSELLKCSPSKKVISEEGMRAFRATLDVLKEVLSNPYSLESAVEYTRWSCSILWTHLHGGASLYQKSVEAFLQRVHAGNVQVHQQVEDGDNLYAQLKQEGTTFAFFKHSARVEKSSHEAALEGYPQFRCAEHERIASEVDAIFGLNRSQIVCKVSYIRDDKAQFGVLRTYDNNVLDGYDLVTKKEGEGARLIRTLPQVRAQITALSSIIQGRADGQWANYLFVLNPEQNALLDVRDIDIEEGLIPFNRIPSTFKMKSEEERIKALGDQRTKLLEAGASQDSAGVQEVERQLEACQKNYDTARKTLAMCRVFILAVPQNAVKLERAALMILSHPSLSILVKAHIENMRQKAYQVHPASLDAYAERIHALQEIARKSIAANECPTPRDVYFQLFGGDALYRHAREKGYGDLTIFSQLVGSPYVVGRKLMESFSQPETIKAPRVPDPIAAGDEPVRNLRRNEEVLRSV